MRKSHIRQQTTIGFLICLLSLPAFASRPRFSDQQIAGMTPQYFKRMSPEKDLGKPPECLGANIYRHPQRGKVFQVDVRIKRNLETEGLAFAFSAMLTLSQYFQKPPDLFVAVLHSEARGTPPVICTSDAECTENHYLHQRVSYEEWYNDCIAFERTWAFGIAPTEAGP